MFSTYDVIDIQYLSLWTDRQAAKMTKTHIWLLIYVYDFCWCVNIIFFPVLTLNSE